MEHKIKKVVAVVTGGSSGIGKSITERIVSLGGKVVVIDIDEDKGLTLSNKSESILFVKADVTSEEQVKAAIEKAQKKFKYINVLINSAGIVKWGAVYDFDKNAPLPLENFKKVMDVNTIGIFNVTRLVCGVMARNEPDEHGERGVIINIASVLASDGNVDFFAYCVSKAAVVGMTLPLARTLADKGIRVVTVSPGYLNSPMTRNELPLEVLNAAMMKLNLFPKRLGQPEEIAHLLQCVIENPFINAVNLTAAGGFHFTQ